MAISTKSLLKELRQVLPAAAILATAEELRPFECDGLSAYRQLPRLVLLPENIDEIRAAMRVCRRHYVPVVARGAGTGLSGGALPDEHGVLLSLTKFTRILSVDVANRMAVVEPGVTNLAISDAVAQHGLYYAPDPSSQIACTIGGNVAENSGGVHCLKYGLTVHNILGAKVCSIDGEILEIGGHALDVPGYDLLAVITGSEGLLGVLVEITVKLLPKPDYTEVALASFERVDDAGNAVTGVIAAGIVPAGLEMMDRLAIHAVEEYVQAGYPLDAEAILICEVDGVRDDVDDQIARVGQIFRDNDATDVRIAGDPEQRQKFWAGRKAAFPAIGRIAPDYYCMDGTIPRHRLSEVLVRITELSAHYGLPVANVFHAGDGNLHPLIAYDANIAEQLHKAEQLGGEILELCVAVGGTITGEHGVGVEKLDQMCVQFQASELNHFHGLNRAFDEHRLLNPGKAVPTLKRCAELGGMHVHNGELPFPELDRF